MKAIWSDITYAFRLLKKYPAFTAVAAGTLALGIAANTVVFTAIDSFVLRPLPFPNPDRLVLMRQAVREGEIITAVTWPDYQDWRQQATSFAEIGAFQIDTFNLTGVANPERIRGCRADSAFFRTVGLPAQRGRAFLPADDATGSPAVALISDAFWESHFGRAPDVLGQTLTIDGASHTIVGVLSPQHRIPMGFNDIWVSLASRAAKYGRGDHSLAVIGRLKPGITDATAYQQLDAIARRLETAYPDTNKGYGVWIINMQEGLARQPRQVLMVLFGAVAFVLLICCANIANLLMARGAGRTREIAVRGALGASRWRLMRQLLIESAVLAGAGGLLGILLARWGVDALAAAIPPVIHPAGGLHMNSTVLLYTLALCAGTALIFGLLPAWKLMRACSSAALKDGTRAGSISLGRSRLSSVLVVAEVSLAVLLLSCAGIMMGNVVRLHNTGLGFEPAGVLTAEIAVNSSRYPQPEQQAAVLQNIVQRMETLPGVEAAAAVNWPPMTSDTTRSYVTEGHVPSSTDKMPWAAFRIATEGYLKTLGIRLSKGRFFTAADARISEPVAVVNTMLARTAFPGQDALGRHIALSTGPNQPVRWMRIVGIIDDVRQVNPTNPPRPELYVPFSQNPVAQMYLTLRTSGDPAALARPLNDAVRSIDPDLPLNLVRTMERVMADSMSAARIATGMMSIFAALALGMAAMGLFGVISFLVASRTYEFGVRLALGATASNLFRLVLTRSLLLAGSGAFLGILGGLGAARILRSMLFGSIQPEPLAFIAVAALFAAVAMAASWVPLRRALALDPVRALRTE